MPKENRLYFLICCLCGSIWARGRLQISDTLCPTQIFLQVRCPFISSRSSFGDKFWTSLYLAVIRMSPCLKDWLPANYKSRQEQLRLTRPAKLNTWFGYAGQDTRQRPATCTQEPVWMRIHESGNPLRGGGHTSFLYKSSMDALIKPVDAPWMLL